MGNKSLSKKEITARVSEIVRRQYKGRRYKVEVGYRTNQEDHVFPNGVTPEEYWKFYGDSGADLDYHDSFSYAIRSVGMRQEGIVLHVYVSMFDSGEWEIDDVLTIWVGNSTMPAEVL